MITAIIVDDEQKSILTLQKIIEDYCEGVKVIGVAENIITARELILSHHPQLVFLDIEMPFGSGFELLKSFDNITFEIVFVTAYDQYAVTAFKYASIDYLLKPIDIGELQETVLRVHKRVAEKSNAENYFILKQNLAAVNRQDQHIMLAGKNDSSPVKISEISYCVADGSYTFIHLVDKQRFHTSKNLKEYEEMLPADSFFRIHYGHIINLQHIVKLRKGRTGSVIMRDGKELEIAARRKNDFLSVLARLSHGH